MSPVEIKIRKVMNAGGQHLSREWVVTGSTEEQMSKEFPNSIGGILLLLQKVEPSDGH